MHRVRIRKECLRGASETDNGFTDKDQSKHLLKSNAPVTGPVYVRLLVEDDPDEVDSGIQRSLDEFTSEVNGLHQEIQT